MVAVSDTGYGWAAALTSRGGRVSLTDGMDRIMGLLAKLFGVRRPETPPDLGRNDPCWCGSGKKYKQCHLALDEAKKRRAMEAACKVRT
jgi:hypothetical protein